MKSDKVNGWERQSDSRLYRCKAVHCDARQFTVQLFIWIEFRWMQRPNIFSAVQELELVHFSRTHQCYGAPTLQKDVE